MAVSPLVFGLITIGVVVITGIIIYEEFLQTPVMQQSNKKSKPKEDKRHDMFTPAESDILANCTVLQESTMLVANESHEMFTPAESELAILQHSTHSDSDYELVCKDEV
jgi:hypothetical protein